MSCLNAKISLVPSISAQYLQPYWSLQHTSSYKLHPNTKSHKPTKIYTLRPLTYELFFQKSSITACVCVVDHYHIRVEIHQMAQTHKEVNKIHSVEIRRLTTDACIHMKRTHHPPLTHQLTSWALFSLGWFQHLIAQGDVRFTLPKTLASSRIHPHKASCSILHQAYT